MRSPCKDVQATRQALERFAVVLVDCGITMVLVGFLNVLRPWKWLHVQSRTAAGWILASGAMFVVVGMALPPQDHHVPSATTKLDEFTPIYQFNEVHEITVEATCPRTYEAVKNLTGNEFSLIRTLLWMRRFDHPDPKSILNNLPYTPVLDVALQTSFLKLAEEPERELVVGKLVRRPANIHIKRSITPEQFKAINDPGIATATMNFLLEPIGASACNVRTETRVFATSANARRGFAAYWRVIYPGSAFLRRLWLRAIKQKAEA